MKNTLILSIFVFLQWTHFAYALYGIPQEFSDEVTRYSAAPECSGEQSAWRNCKSILSWDDQIIYSGNFLDGQPHGFGIKENLKTKTEIEGLWYKGDLIFGVMSSDGQRVSTTAYSSNGEMIGFTEIIAIKDRSGLKHSNRFNYAHLDGQVSIGNIVTEIYKQGNLDSAYLGPGDGLTPSDIGFLYFKGVGYKWCSAGAKQLPCSQQKIQKTAIKSLRNSFNDLTEPERMRIQTALQKLFYYTSTIDGKWGQNTQYALMKYLALHTSVPLFPDANFSISFVKETFVENELYDLHYGDMTRLNEVGYTKTTNSFGTGFLFTNSGEILTNNHVVSECSNIMFSLNDKVVEVSLKGSDAEADLAILSSDLKPKSLLPMKIENSELELMDKVFAVGFPFGGEIAKNITVTSGIISSEPEGTLRSKIFQFDAAIQPGNSGGPVIDENKNLIGIATAKADLEYFLKKYGTIPEGIAFAVDLESIINFLEENNYNPTDISDSGSSPKLKDIVGMITCVTNNKMDLREIHRARLR